MHLEALLLQIGVVLLVGRVLAAGFARAGQPAVIAEIAAGIALGPSALGAIRPDAMAWLFPPETLGQLGAVAQLGLVFFMFLVGLEFDAGLLEGRRRVALAISGAGILVPLALGTCTAVLLPADLVPPGVARSANALFLGVAMSVTAFPILARILAERGLTRTPVGALALASAAVDDVAAWCLLALVAGYASATGGTAAATVVGGALALAGLAFLVLRPALRRFASGDAGTPGTDRVAAVVVAVLFFALAADQIGVHALFGGFLVGAAVPREGELRRELHETIGSFVTLALLPLFFAYSGLRTELGSLDSLLDWGITAALLAVAMLGKLGGCMAAGLSQGLSTRDAAAVGVLMNTRGLMEIVVLNIGLDLGVIGERMFAMMVLVALATTAMTSPLLRRVIPDAGAVRSGRP